MEVICLVLFEGKGLNDESKYFMNNRQNIKFILLSTVTSKVHLIINYQEKNGTHSVHLCVFKPNNP